MSYEREMQFLRTALQKCHIQTARIGPDCAAWAEENDSYLYQMLRMEADQGKIMEFLRATQERTIYRVSDRFMCRYLVLRLPGETAYPLLVIGPYLTEELSREQIMELAEWFGIPAAQFQLFEHFYAGVPKLTETYLLYSMVESLCQSIWGEETIVGVEVDESRGDLIAPFHPEESAPKAENAEWNMRMMEQRYACENELMQAVSQGSVHKVELIFSAFNSLAFESRISDRVRNMKNYCIIMNTLLRKAAENGGVHPIHLDSISSEFAKKIETLPTADAAKELMTDMFRSYCRLVKKNSMKQYSPQVQRTVLRIDSDLGGDLSLKRLAEQQNINASYLSTIFKRETGHTITEYIVRRRIQLARQLLSTTQLQIQTIAQHCGIPDVNYFSKTFKKYVGVTPKQFRQESRMHAKS